MADRLLNLPSMRSWSFFARLREKSGYMKMSLFNVQLHLCMIYPLCKCVLGIAFDEAIKLFVHALWRFALGEANAF